MIVWVIIFIISLLVLIKSADYFTESSMSIGIRMGMSPFIVGITIVAVGTSIPELATSIVAVIKHSTDFIAGNVVGSNIANIFFILGVTAIASGGLKISRKIMRFDIPMLIAIVFVLVAMMYNGVFTPFDSIILIVIFALYMIQILSTQKKELEREIEYEVKDIHNKNRLTLAKNLFIMSVSSFLIYIGAKYTIESVIGISNILHIGKDIIATSVVAFGTSLPELAVSINAVRKKNVDIAFGNIIGSNIFNSSIVMSVAGLFGSFAIPKGVIHTGLPVMALSVVLLFLIVKDKKMTILEGWFFVFMYALFIGGLFL